MDTALLSSLAVSRAATAKSGVGSAQGARLGAMHWLSAAGASPEARHRARCLGHTRGSFKGSAVYSAEFLNRGLRILNRGLTQFTPSHFPFLFSLATPPTRAHGPGPALGGSEQVHQQESCGCACAPRLAPPWPDHSSPYNFPSLCHTWRAPLDSASGASLSPRSEVVGQGGGGLGEDVHGDSNFCDTAPGATRTAGSSVSSVEISSAQ